MYVLEKGKTFKIDDPILWATLTSGRNRTLRKTRFDNLVISTVFLGIDHGDGGKPLLFETCIFNYDICEGDSTPESFVVYRYSTREEAIEGHMAFVKGVRIALKVIKRKQIQDKEERWQLIEKVLYDVIGENCPETSERKKKSERKRGFFKGKRENCKR